MKPFIIDGLIQFPDYRLLRLILPKIETHGQAPLENYFTHDVGDYPFMRDFIAQFDVKPYAALISKFGGGEELPLHTDARSTVKIHFPIETDDCSINFYSPPPASLLIDSHCYRREEPVLLDVQVPHTLINRSRNPKYSLILSWDSLDFGSAARMLEGRP